MFDTLIKNGTVIDGTGGPVRSADVAIKDGRIAAVDTHIDGAAHEVIDARGLLVTPGFVDVHTHYDGQVTWDDAILPSSAHGVTTIVIGTCGIGFAPVRPGTEDWLISVMEGVEDIPGTVLHEGMQWSWESFPGYLDALGSRRYALDIATHVPHSAVRAYVMGRRAADDEPATEAEIRAMADIVRAGIEAGALGFGTSRIAMHQATDGSMVPGTTASEMELHALATAVRNGGGGVIQLVPSGAGGNTAGSLATMGKRADRRTLLEELELMCRLTDRTEQPVTFSLSSNAGLGADMFERVVNAVDRAFARGQRIYPQISSRPAGILSSFETFHAFQARPTYLQLASLPFEECIAKLREPKTKRAILSEKDNPPQSTVPIDSFHLALQGSLSALYELDDPPDYEPDPSLSIMSKAVAARREPLEFLYDAMLERDGRALMIAFATNYLEGDLRLTEQLMRRPGFVLGLGDGGAHVRAICDGSLPTFLLSHWARDRKRGNTLPIELLVKKQTHDTAALYGLNDRGVIEVGRRADLNVLDFARLNVRRPRLVDDLPANGVRFLQDSEGYVLTLVAGTITRRNDRDTGARPGRLVRGAQHA